MKETKEYGEKKQWPAAHMLKWFKFTLSWASYKLTTFVVIDTDCIGKCKSDYSGSIYFRWYQFSWIKSESEMFVDIWIPGFDAYSQSLLLRSPFIVH